MDSMILESVFQEKAYEDVANWATSLVKPLSNLTVYGTFERMQNFQFVPGELPLSTWQEAATTVVVYVAVIHLLQSYVAWRGKPFNLKKTVLIHNSVLAVASLLLWCALTAELIHLSVVYGMHQVWFDCTEKLGHGRHYVYYYINYILKYVELIDTVMLALQAKPVIFLHEYHHAATLVLCWVQLAARTAMQWVVIDINLFIHIAMYGYYALSTRYRDIWWKRYLTSMQIMQFVVSCIIGFTMLGLRLMHDVLDISWAPKSSGSYFSAVFGLAILVSYLVLFVDLYRQKYPQVPNNLEKAGNGKYPQKLADSTSIESVKFSWYTPPKSTARNRKTTKY